MRWPPKDWRAIIALLGSIAGAAALTALLWWGLWMLLPAKEWWTGATEEHRAQTIRIALWIVAGTISLVIIGLGFAVNRRSFKASLGDKASFNFEGGDSDAVMPPKMEMPEPHFGKDAP